MSREKLRTFALNALVPVVVVVGWWWWSRDSGSVYFPPLTAILESLWDVWVQERFASDVVPSLRRMFAGYALAIILGIAVGVVLARVHVLGRALNPLVQFSRSIPPVALVPVAVLLLGIGDTMKIALIAFVCFFPVLLNTIDGVRAVNQTLEDMARSFRLTARQRLVSLLLPSAAPQIFAGMRIALAVAFILMIVTEMVAATNGIGHATLSYQTRFRIPAMWSGMVLLAVLGYLFNVVFVAVERRVLRWHYQMTRSSQGV